MVLWSCECSSWPWLYFSPLPHASARNCWLFWANVLISVKTNPATKKWGLLWEQSGGQDQLCCYMSHRCYIDVTAKLGGNGLQGSNLTSWGSTTAPSAEQEGGANEGRSLVLLLPRKSWWWPTEDWVKFGHIECADSFWVHSPNFLQLEIPTLPWLMHSVCCWNVGLHQDSEKPYNHRIAEWLRLEGTSEIA